VCSAALGDASWHEADSFMKSGGYSNLASKIMQIDKPTLIFGESDQTLGIGDAVKFQRAIALLNSSGSKLWSRSST